jgi:hypothetical protein
MRLRRLLGVMATSVLPVVASAQEPPAAPAPSRPAYQPYRYDEDWSPLIDPRLRTDPVDRVKYIPLGSEPGWYVSAGGETRWRYEQVAHPAFGAQTTDRSGYLLQRHLLHADWHLGAHVRVFTEVQSGIEGGRLGGPRPTDEDRLDLHQAFVDVTWGTASRGSLTLRAGRHEVAFGAGRLISAAEGLNVRRGFDGLRLIGRRHGWTFNSTLMRLVAARPGLFDDRADTGQLTWGVGGFGPIAGPTRGNLAVYYIGMRREQARFEQGVGDATRHSFGVRTWRIGRVVDYDEEVIVQRGQFASASIRAWAVASEFGVTGQWSRRPRAGIRTFVASGDRDPSDPALGSFDPLFPGIAYSGRAAVVGPTNLMTIDPSIGLALNRRVRVSADWAQFWRTSRRDGLYGINVAVLRPGAGSEVRGVGAQGTVEVDARVSARVSLWASATVFHTGPFIRAVPPGRDLRYLAAHAAYRF